MQHWPFLTKASRTAIYFRSTRQLIEPMHWLANQMWRPWSQKAILQSRLQKWSPESIAISLWCCHQIQCPCKWDAANFTGLPPWGSNLHDSTVSNRLGLIRRWGWGAIKVVFLIVRDHVPELRLPGGWENEQMLFNFCDRRQAMFLNIRRGSAAEQPERMTIFTSSFIVNYSFLLILPPKSLPFLNSFIEIQVACHKTYQF